MKTIYLDQNKWVDFRNAEHGLQVGQRFTATLQAARSTVAAGATIFPISRAHLIETARVSDAEQRKTMAQLMTELSQGVVLRTTQRLAEASIGTALRKLFGVPESAKPLSGFGRGLDECLGFSWSAFFPDQVPEWVELFRQHADSPDKWKEVLSSGNELARIAGIVSTDKAADSWADTFAGDREDLKNDSPSVLRRLLYARATVYFRPAIERSLAEMGKTFTEFAAVGEDRLMKFWSGIPCVRAQSEFEYALLRDRNYKLERNDLRDLGFLGTAIPYCDIVVAERHSIAVAKRAKLDEAFDTVLLTDLAELEPLIS